MSSRVRAGSRLGSEPAASATTMLVADHAASTAALPEHADVQGLLHHRRRVAHQPDHGKPGEQRSADRREELRFAKQVRVEHRAA